MTDFIVWVFTSIGQAFVNVAYAVTHPASWLAWTGEVGERLTSTEAKESLARFIYYGGSKELFFAVFTLFLILTVIGIFYRPFMWGILRGIEWFANGLGRIVAWAGLIMVLQQIMVIFLQGVFRNASIEIGHLGYGFTRDVSWWSEELKLYNAAIICLSLAYTFIQGGHVRVDLVYSAVRYRTKKAIDMFGALIFMMPMAVLMWLYAWYFMWRHMVVPNPNASGTLDKMLTQSRALRWNLETTSFSPNGFDGYFMFKILMVMLAGLIFVQAIAVFYRSYLCFVEGEASEGKYLDKDTLGEGEEAYEGTH